MFRFTIRDLLWLMVVVGMGVGWCVDRISYQRLLRSTMDSHILKRLDMQEKIGDLERANERLTFQLENF